MTENEKVKPKNHKKLLAVVSVITAVLVTLFVFLATWYWGDNYKDFEDFKSEFEIPGLDEGAAPQGITSYKTKVIDKKTGAYSANQNQNYFFISAYFDGGKPSKIYVTGSKTGYLGYVTMKMKDSSEYYKGHAGGIATNGYTLWVGSDHTVYTAMTDSGSGYTNMCDEIIKKSLVNGEITFSDSFSPNCEASFLFYYDSDPESSSLTNDRLYVGEFYRPGKFETEKLHHLKTPSGDINHSLVFEYTPYSGNATNRKGLYVMSGTTTPTVNTIYSIPDQIQGFALTTNGTLILSQSYGLPNSHLLTYDFTSDGIKKSTNGTSFKAAAGKDIYYDGLLTENGNSTAISANLYYVDSSFLIKDYSVPAMTEGLCVTSNGREPEVNVLFESGAKKYRLFVRQSIKTVYSFIPPVPKK